MGKVITGMSMSLDGFIQDSNGSVERLYTDFSELVATRAFKEMIQSTGAVVMGRRVYEMADPFSWANDDYEFQPPIFVLTHTPPLKYPAGNGRLSFTFVSDGIASAIAQAKSAAGNKDVQIIGGPNTIQQCLNAGLCDELLIDILPVVLGKGLKLLENIDTEKVSFERIKVEEITSERTSLTFKIAKAIQAHK